MSFSACQGSSASDCKRTSKSTAKKGEMAAFLIYSHVQLTMKVGLSIQLNNRPTLKNDLFLI